MMQRPNKPIIRVTQIEAFRRFITNGDHSYYEITEESLIESITGQFKGNCKTRIGTAFHSVVENVGKETLVEALTDGCKFNIDGNDVYLSPEQMHIALRYKLAHPTAFHEVRRYADYGAAYVTGCADMIDGLEIRDIKTKFRTPTDSEYTDSAQWRFYLDIFGADTFHFDLFVFDGYKDEMLHDVRQCTLEAYTPPITCYRYPLLHQDCQHLVNEFMQWAESRNLVKYLNYNSL